jgi:hypothetical protein
MKRLLSMLSLGAIMIAGVGAVRLVPALQSTAAPANAAPPAATTGIALPAPKIPGVAHLPGPIAAPATLSPNLGILNVTPERGVTGKPFTISGAGLQKNAQVTLTWSTSNVTWMADPQPDTVNYLGRSATPLTVVIKKTTTNSSGAFSVKLKAPNDWGGLHDIYAVINGVQMAHGGYLIDRSVTMSPKSGPIGTPITVTYRGLGASLYEGGASLLYDNHYAGEMMANWTRGTAQAVIRAAGPVGNHTIQVGDAITYLYMNLQQSPLPWAVGATKTFRVTKDNGPPKPSMDWPVSVAPTVSARTTLQLTGVDPHSQVHMKLSSTGGPVNSRVGVSASGLTSKDAVNLVWSTVVGSRVNCKGTCWEFVSIPLGQMTPSGPSLKTKVSVPDGLGGWHVVQIVQGGKIIAQEPFFVKESIVGKGVSSIVVKQGQPFSVHLKGVGWTQIDNVRAVDYDNSYVGYGCGFNSQGDVVVQMHATGGPGTHLIDIYPMLYTLSPSFANTPYGMVPFLTYGKDYPGLALGYQLPAVRLAITVVK